MSLWCQWLPMYAVCRWILHVTSTRLTALVSAFWRGVYKWRSKDPETGHAKLRTGGSGPSVDGTYIHIILLQSLVSMPLVFCTPSTPMRTGIPWPIGLLWYGICFSFFVWLTLTRDSDPCSSRAAIAKERHCQQEKLWPVQDRREESSLSPLPVTISET